MRFTFEEFSTQFILVKDMFNPKKPTTKQPPRSNVLSPATQDIYSKTSDNFDKQVALAGLTLSVKDSIQDESLSDFVKRTIESVKEFHFENPVFTKRDIYRASLRRDLKVILDEALPTLKNLSPNISDEAFNEKAKNIIREASIKFIAIEQLSHMKKPKPVVRKMDGVIVRTHNLDKKVPTWRSDLQTNFQNSKYFDAYVVQRITGCRPEELEKGVKLIKVDDGYELCVDTAKEREDKKISDTPENRIRKIFTNEQNELLGNIANRNNGVVSIQRKGAYKKEFERRTISLFRVPLTSYALRYAVSADLRYSGMSTLQIAGFLGHCDDQNAYGYSKGMATGGKGREQPAKVTQARIQVRDVNNQNLNKMLDKQQQKKNQQENKQEQKQEQEMER